jgi:hypothetical protein
MKTLSILAAVASVFAVSTASAQDLLSTQYDGVLNNAIGQMYSMGAQMQGYEAQITQGAMNDPQVQAGYQAYVAQGGYQDFATWAFNYRATNGYDPAAVQQVYRDQATATANLQQGWAGVQSAEQASAAAIAGMQGGFATNMGDAGLNLQGQQIYNTPTGGQTPLSYMQSAPQSYDPSNGFTYVPNGNGTYTAYDANGFAYPMPN